MVEKLSVLIELEGGEQIAKQLEGVGEAGQKVFADLAKSAEQAGGFKNIKPDEVTASLEKMGVTGVDSIKKIQDAVKSAARLETLVSGIASVETALLAVAKVAPIVGVAIVAAMTAATKATIAFAGDVNKINDQAIKLGVGVQQVDQFRAALEKAGVSATSIGQILSSKLASEQGVRGLEAFIQSLQQMPDSASRSKRAVEEFGAAGAELIRILQAGGRLTGIRVGGLISAEDAKRATELGVAINQLESSIGRLNTLAFAPVLTVGINAAANAVEILGQRLQQTPWTTFWNAASLGSPITSLISTIAGGINALSPPIEQVGIAAQQTSTIFTAWGTVAKQGGEEAAQGVQQAAGMFTSFGTVASQSADKANASMQQAAGGAQSLSDKVAAFASQLAGITWDAILGTGAAAWNGLISVIQRAATVVSDFASQIASLTWDSISSAGVAAWNALSGAIQGAYDWLLKYIGLRPSAPPVAGGGSGGIGHAAAGGLLGGRGTGTSDSNLAWVSRGEHIMPAAVVRRPGVLSLLEALRRGGGIPGFAAGGVAGNAAGGGDELWNFLDRVTDQLDRALGALTQDLIQTILRISKDVEMPMQALLGLMSQIKGKASGGLLGGRGSGTSDSNLAWVSRGEYITPARAVRQPGVLEFLELLRRSGGNLRAVLDGMGRFALGGMVPRAIPAFASGGLAGGSHVTIQFPGLPAISGLRASSDVVDQLHRAAALAQVRSGGRKPSRYS